MLYRSTFDFYIIVFVKLAPAEVFKNYRQEFHMCTPLKKNILNYVA